MGFLEVADLAHRAEDDLAAGRRPDVSALREQLELDVADVRRVLGLEELDGKVVIAQQALAGLVAWVEPDLGEAIRDLARQPLARALDHHVRAAHALAERLERTIEVVVHGDTIDDLELASLDTSVLHCLTNAVTPDRPLKISITVRRAHRQLLMWIGDDGRGVDVDRLVARAVTSGRWSAARAAAASDEERVGLVFEPGLTTRDDVSATAGRGEGLSAVRSDVLDRGGRVSVSSRVGAGTVFEFVLPAPRYAPTPQSGDSAESYAGESCNLSTNAVKTSGSTGLTR